MARANGRLDGRGPEAADGAGSRLLALRRRGVCDRWMNGPLYRQQPWTVSQGGVSVNRGEIEMCAFYCFMF